MNPSTRCDAVWIKTYFSEFLLDLVGVNERATQLVKDAVDMYVQENEEKILQAFEKKHGSEAFAFSPSFIAYEDRGALQEIVTLLYPDVFAQLVGVSRNEFEESQEPLILELNQELSLMNQTYYQAA